MPGDASTCRSSPPTTAGRTPTPRLRARRRRRGRPRSARAAADPHAYADLTELEYFAVSWRYGLAGPALDEGPRLRAGVQPRRGARGARRRARQAPAAPHPAVAALLRGCGAHRLLDRSRKQRRRVRPPPWRSTTPTRHSTSTFSSRRCATIPASFSRPMLLHTTTNVRSPMRPIVSSLRRLPRSCATKCSTLGVASLSVWTSSRTHTATLQLTRNARASATLRAIHQERPLRKPRGRIEECVVLLTLVVRDHTAAEPLRSRALSAYALASDDVPASPYANDATGGNTLSRECVQQFSARSESARLSCP